MQERCVSVRPHLFKLLQRCLSRALCTQYSRPRLAESFIGAARTSGPISHIPLSMYTRSSVCKHKPVFEFFCSHILLREAMMVTFAPESLMFLTLWIFFFCSWRSLREPLPMCCLQSSKTNIRRYPLCYSLGARLSLGLAQLVGLYSIWSCLIPASKTFI